MNVIPTAQTKRREMGYRNNIAVNSSIRNYNEMPKDNVSFSGAISTGTNYLKNGLTEALKWIKSKGFIAEFLIIDTFSMIIPRICVGLDRDRDKTGKTNYKAGIEEAGREVISGPSMFFIPMAVAWGIRKLAPASKILSKPLETMSSIMNETINNVKNIGSLTNKTDLDKAYAENLFDRVTKNFVLDEKSSFKERFVNLITNQTKESSEKFNELIAEMHNKNKATDIPVVELHNVSLGKQNGKEVILNSSELFSNFGDYSKDITSKLTKQNYASKALDACKNEMTKIVEKSVKSRNAIRIATGITAFLAIGNFLLQLPKLYQQGKLSPAEESALRAKSQKTKTGGANEN